VSRVIAATNSSDTTSKAQLQTVLAPSSTNWTLDGVEGSDILDAQNTASGLAGSWYIGTDLLIPPYPNVSINVDKQVIQGLRLYGDSRPNLEDLFQAEVLEAVANRYFGAMRTLIASKSFKRSDGIFAGLR
jgi:hypothetical protein